MFFQVIGEQSAGQIARRFIVSLRKLSLTAEEVSSALAHTTEGYSTSAVRNEAPQDTGALRQGIHTRVIRDGGAFVVSIESDAPYTDFVVHGTGIHHTPDAHSSWDVSGLQAFGLAGETIFAQHTHHEGQEPDDFVTRGMERAAPLVRAALVLAGEKILVSFRSDWEAPL